MKRLDKYLRHNLFITETYKENISRYYYDINKAWRFINVFPAVNKSAFSIYAILRKGSVTISRCSLLCK